jgi:hypothetical protein
VSVPSHPAPRAVGSACGPRSACKTNAAARRASRLAQALALGAPVARPLIWRNGRLGPARSLVSMQNPDTASSLESLAPPQAWHSALACASWRVLWVVLAAGWVLTLPDSPSKWPALALLVASALVLHADSIARPIRRRLAGRL